MDQFESKKLAPMLERAGYHMVAADLDIDKIESLLPEVEVGPQHFRVGVQPVAVGPRLRLAPLYKLVRVEGPHF